jgi:hypothetical protein
MKWPWRFMNPEKESHKFHPAKPYCHDWHHWDLLLPLTWASNEFTCKDAGERAVQSQMVALFEVGCTCTDGRRRLMVDIGANTGFYGELAIFHGCDAVFADMQPACVRWIQATLLVNALSAHGAIIPYGISDKEESLGRLNFTEHDCNIKYHLPQLRKPTDIF